MQEVGVRADILGPDYFGNLLREPSGILSVNIIWEHKKGVRLSKTNCRSIEVAMLHPAPLSPPKYLAGDLDELKESFGEEKGKEALEHPLEEMDADQESPVSPISAALSRAVSSSTSTFPFLHLPLELRLKIYKYLLPARNHTIVTQIPHNGYFYNTLSIPAHSAQSFYPFGTKAPNNLTTYKVLSSNFRSSYPWPSVCTAILRTSSQVKEEAEGVLYGSSDTIWDFGVHLDACRAFWGDRSPSARRLVKSLRVAREIPCFDDGKSATDARWVAFCAVLQAELLGLRSLDLTIWSSTGSAASFPVSIAAIPSFGGDGNADWEEFETVSRKRKEEERKWREWESISELLDMEALRMARITWWGFENLGVGRGEGAFDSWLAGRMVGDEVVRERMIRDGVVVEGVVILSGRGK
jgi:hypothetical protein